MARATIGLDIGTTAVRAAELRGKDPATLTRFAQLTVPAGGMVAGKIADPAAVADVIKDLWRRGEFRARQVALGVANEGVVARLVEMPSMSEDELRGALQYQVQDYIPIPIDDALLDFLPLETFTGEEGAPMMRVLAVAAQKEMVNSFVDAARRAGLEPVSVDMSPLAALRALVEPGLGPVLGERQAEALVDIGGGVTTIAVHESGTPRFVRVLTAGGADITAALVSDLALAPEDAEAQKVGLGLQPEGAPVDPGPATVIEQRARAFIDDVRRSIDYYQSQPDGSRIGRVLVCGGGSRLRGLSERLATALRIPVEEGSALTRVKVGDLGLSEEQLVQVAAIGAVAVGLAMEA